MQADGPLDDAGCNAPAASGVGCGVVLTESGGIERVRRSRGRGECLIGAGEVRVVKDVEGFQAHLESEPLGDRDVLYQREVLVEESRAAELVVSQISHLARSRNRETGSSLACSAHSRRAGSALDGH